MQDRSDLTHKKELKHTRKEKRPELPEIQFERRYRHALKEEGSSSLWTIQRQKQQVYSNRTWNARFQSGFIKQRKGCLKPDLAASFYGKNNSYSENPLEYSATLSRTLTSPPIFYFRKQRSRITYREPFTLQFSQDPGVSFGQLVYLHSQKQLFNFRSKKTLLKVSGFKEEKTEHSQETLLEFTARSQREMNESSPGTHGMPPDFQFGKNITYSRLRSEIKRVEKNPEPFKKEDDQGPESDLEEASSKPPQFRWLIRREESWEVKVEDMNDDPNPGWRYSYNNYSAEYNLFGRKFFKFWRHMER